MSLMMCLTERSSAIQRSATLRYLRCLSHMGECLSASALVLLLALYCPAQEPPWHTNDHLRWRDLLISNHGRTSFEQLSPERTGIHFTNILDEAASAANRILEDGSGAAIGDFDGDGRPDIFLCSLQGHNALYRN